MALIGAARVSKRFSLYDSGDRRDGLGNRCVAHDVIRLALDGRLVLHGRLPGARCCQSPRPAHDLEGTTHGLGGLLQEHLRALVAESPQRV